MEVIESTSSVIDLGWKYPKDDGGSAVTNYIIERQQVGQAMWKKLGDVSADRLTFRDRNVAHGKQYNYRIYAENPEGIGEPLVTIESIMAGILGMRGPIPFQAELLIQSYSYKGKGIRSVNYEQIQNLWMVLLLVRA